MTTIFIINIVVIIMIIIVILIIIITNIIIIIMIYSMIMIIIIIKDNALVQHSTLYQFLKRFCSSMYRLFRKGSRYRLESGRNHLLLDKLIWM